MKNKRPVLLGMAVHPPKLAATRLRLTQYFPYFEEAGFQCQLWTFLSERDLKWWHGTSTLARVLVTLRALLRVPRALMLMRRCDVVVVQRECLPFGPPVLEWYAARHRTLIWDVDDFIWERYVSPTAGSWTTWLRTSERKHDRICGWASECWAGSDAIADWIRHRSSEIYLVPTVVYVPDHRLGIQHRRPVALWVGSHSTVRFLETVISSVAESAGLEAIQVIGGKPRCPPPLVEQIEWSLEAESEVCNNARVGLYPVDEKHVYAEGKCGLKAVLYMAHGLPMVVSPTRPNTAIVRDGVEGIYAETAFEWREAVEMLLSDDPTWDKLSRAAHTRALESYSLQVWGPRVAMRARDLRT